MKLNAPHTVKHSNIFKSSIIIYFIITQFSLVNMYAYSILGGRIVTILQYLPVAIILKQVLDNSIVRRKIKYSLYILWLIPFVFFYYLCFEVLAARSSFVQIISGITFNLSTIYILNIVPVFVISWYFIQVKDINFNKLLAFLCLILLTGTMILTLKSLLDDPLIARTLGAGLADEEDYFKGVSGFNMIYSVVLLVPCVIFSISHFNKISRAVLIAFFVLTIVYIYMCGYTIAILTTCLTVFIYLFLSANKHIKILLAFPIVILFVMVIDRSVIYGIFNPLIDKIDVRPVQMRLVAMLDLFVYGDPSASPLSRFNLYSRSLDGFFSSPIIGVFALDESYKLSGHSTTLDILGGCGLLGFIPLCMLIWSSYKYSLEYVGNITYRQCITSSYIAFLCVATLNPQLTSPNVLIALLIINPMACSIIDANGLRDPQREKVSRKRHLVPRILRGL